MSMTTTVRAPKSESFSILRKAASEFRRGCHDKDPLNDLQDEAIPDFRNSIYGEMDSLLGKDSVWRRGEFAFTHQYGFNSTPSQKAEAVEKYITKLLNHPSMKLQGPAEQRGDDKCPAPVDFRCSKYRGAVPAGKSLIHLLAPDGRYVHAYQHQRIDSTQLNQISFREPKPENHSNFVLTTIPSVDYTSFGYTQLGAVYLNFYDEEDAKNLSISVIPSTRDEARRQPIVRRGESLDSQSIHLIGQGATMLAEGAVLATCGVAGAIMRSNNDSDPQNTTVEITQRREPTDEELVSAIGQGLATAAEGSLRLFAGLMGAVVKSLSK